MRTFVLARMFVNFSRFTLCLLSFIRLLHANLLLTLLKNYNGITVVVDQLYHGFTTALPYYINCTRV